MASTVIPSPGTWGTWSAGRNIFTFLAFFSPIAAFSQDMTASHMWNPLWPPHAKFHAGQTMSLSIYNALFLLWLLWYPSPSRDSSFTPQLERLKNERERLHLCATVISTYYITMLMSGNLFPGTAGFDPPYDPSTVPQSAVAVAVLSVIATAWYLENKRLRQLIAEAEDGKKTK
ncbi:MAG: hypothetical protein Q9165_006482 [Trypethelium subeluteriae]